MDYSSKGLQMMLAMGYDRNKKLGKNDNGLLIPIILETRMKNIGIGCTPMSITICGWNPLVNKVKTPQQMTSTLQFPVSIGLPLDNFTFEIANVYSSSDEEDSITNLPRLFKNSSILMLSTVSFETPIQNHEINLVYPQLIDYDQQGPLILDTFKNNEAFSEFMGFQDNIPCGDHKVGFIIKLHTHAYYGETIESLSHKREKTKNNL